MGTARPVRCPLISGRAIRRAVGPLKGLDAFCGILLYDRRGKVRYTNQKICDIAGYAHGELDGKPVSALFSPAFDDGSGPVEPFLFPRGAAALRPAQLVLVFRTRKVFHKPWLDVPREERGGVKVCLVRNAAGRAGTLLIVRYAIQKPMTKKMGGLSTDMMVTIDGRQRVVAASHGFVDWVNRPFPDVIGKPFKSFFVPGALEKAARAQQANIDMMAQSAERNCAPWEPEVEERFRDGWGGKFLADSVLKMRKTIPGILLETDYHTAYLTCRKRIDHERRDVRTEVVFEGGPGLTTLGIFFHGIGTSGRPGGPTPDLNGYLFSLRHNFDTGDLYMRMKRWGKILGTREISSAFLLGRTQLAAEKIGGVFNFYINGEKVFQFVDPLFLRYGQHHATGVVFTSFPVRVYEVRALSRPATRTVRNPSGLNFDLRYRSQPSEVFEAEFFENLSVGERCTDVYLRWVTELRRLQETHRRLVLNLGKVLSSSRLSDKPLQP